MSSELTAADVFNALGIIEDDYIELWFLVAEL